MSENVDTEPQPTAEEAVVQTAGITSQVFEDDDVIGHVLLLDLDNVDYIEAVQVADDLDTIAAVLESSAGSHHIWSLGVNTLREQTIRGLSYHASDDAHVGASWRRGYAVLRAFRKVRDGGETYKERPTLHHVSTAGAEGPHSAAHAVMLQVLRREQSEEVSGEADAARGLDHLSPAGVEWVGDDDDLRLDKYQTLTDDGKAALRE